MIKTEIETRNDKTFVSVEGRMDTLSTKGFMETVRPLLEEKHTHIEFDLKRLDYLCSSGLRIMIEILKSVTNNHGQLVLRHVRPSVREVFDVTGFSNIFVMEE